MHDVHDHLAVCCETIFLKMSSTAGADVAVVDDCAAVVIANEDALLAVDVVCAGAPNVTAAVDVDVDEEDDVESTVGLAPPKANVPNGTDGLVPVDGLPNENFGAAAVAVVAAAALEVVALSVLKLPNVIGLAIDLVLSSGFAVPNVNCGVAVAVVFAVVFDVDAVAFASTTGFEPNENFPLGAPKSMPPLPNENFGFDDDASPVELATVVSLSLAC